MKFILLFLISINAAWAASPETQFNRNSHIKDLDWLGREYMLTIWSDNRVYRLDRDDKNLPCLENARRAHLPVALRVDEKAGVILDCKMSQHALPGQKTKL